MSGSRWLPLLVVFAGSFAFPHDIITTKLTYARDVRPILTHRCLACHGASASIPLASYEQVRPWAVDIKEQVLARTMPPWGAVKGFRALAPDDSLTEDELAIIAAWVVGGAPEGNATQTEIRNPHTPQAVSMAPAQLAEIVVNTRLTLAAPAQVVGILPLTDGVVSSARIIAQLPDGRVEPLLWLAQYNGTTKRAFHFRDALPLPAGTVVTATTPLPFALQTVKSSPPAQ